MINKMARAICITCEENPDVPGDARGNEYRWQDYIPVAEAALQAIGAVEVGGRVEYHSTFFDKAVIVFPIDDGRLVGQRVRVFVIPMEDK